LVPTPYPLKSIETFGGSPATSLNGAAVDELTDPCVSSDGGETVAVAALFGAETATATPAEEAAAAAAEAPLVEADVEVRACCTCAVSVEARLSRRAGERRERSEASFSACSTLLFERRRSSESLVSADVRVSSGLVVVGGRGWLVAGWEVLSVAGCEEDIVVVARVWRRFMDVIEYSWYYH